jgi:hypothetical protein
MSEALLPLNVGHDVAQLSAAFGILSGESHQRTLL